MAKLKLDGGTIKSFFALHVEKFVLAIVVLVLVFFVYRGYSIEGVDETPDDLAQLSERAVEAMEKPTWSLVAAEYTPKAGYPERVQASKMPIEPQVYQPVRTWEPPRAQPGLKRSDPELFPPEKLEVYAVTGPLAHRMKRGDTDLLADLTNWGELSEEELAAEQRKREREAKKKRRATGGGSYGYGEEGEYPGMGGSDEDYGDSSGMGMPGMGGMGMPGMPGMPGMGDEGGYPGMGGYGGMPGTGATTMADAKLWPGFRAGPGAIGREAHIVAVKAIVPYQRQWDEFEQKLSMAVGYNPVRDEPRYVMFFAQRADVTDDPTKEPAETDWKTASSTDYVLQTVIKDWYGRTTEIADPRYVSPKLTMPIPPLMAREVDPLALHSDVPRRQVTLAMRKPAVGDEEDGEKKDEPAADGEISDVPTAPGARPGGYPGMGGGYPGMGGGMYPGMGGGYPGMAGGDSSGMGSGMYPGMGEGYGDEDYGEEYDSEGYEGYGDEGYPGGDSSGMGSGMYPGMGGGMYPGMGGGAGMRSRGPKAEYLLVRFYDLRVAPGRKYRYRIQVLLQDPNHPPNERMDPKERTLDDTVKVRLNQVEAEEAKAEGTRIYYRRSDWSEPSEVVSVEIPDTTLAGEVQLPSAARPIAESPNGRFTVAQSEPTGKLIAVAWDPALAIDVPGPMDVHRGSVLNFSADAAVVHPIRMIYKERPEFAFDTNCVVLDFRGGETLPVTPSEDPRKEEDPLNAPGEYVLLDKTGELYVCNELDDVDAFKRYSPPEPPEPAAGMGYPGGDYPGMEDGGYPGAGGYGGMEEGGYPGGYPGASGAGGSGGRRRGRR